MNIGVPSRFACLKIEDEESRPQSVKLKEVKKKNENKSVTKKPIINVKSDKDLKSKKDHNKQATSSTSTKSKKHSSTEQWEEWKVKDSEIVNGNYEQDLQNAIMLSKLDYEHNKDLYKKSAEVNIKVTQQMPNKKKKKKAMHINEFLNEKNEKQGDIRKVENHIKEKHFFDDIKISTKEELNKEQLNEKRKKREVNIDGIISLAQCQGKLETERAKRLSLQVELDKAKVEIAAVKERNKSLCGILGNAEMKDKADVVAELEKLYIEKNELAEEVSKLHILLEQERSKVAVLSSDTHNNKHKDKKRKQKAN